MKNWWQAIAFSIITAIALCFVAILNLQNANAQTTGAVAAAQKPLYARLAWKRTSPSDLELGGDILGATQKQVPRYITREQLLALPQVSYTVTNDANFSGPTELSGVALDQLIQALAANPQSDLAVAAGVGEEIGPTLAEHPDVALIAFTGSRGGRRLRLRKSKLRPGGCAIRKRANSPK